MLSACQAQHNRQLKRQYWDDAATGSSWPVREVGSLPSVFHTPAVDSPQRKTRVPFHQMPLSNPPSALHLPGFQSFQRFCSFSRVSPNSVLSNRSVDEIAAAGDHQWHSNRSVKANVKAGAIPKQVRSAAVTKSTESRKSLQKDVGKRSAMTTTLSPMLATLVKTAPTGDDWVHEVKYDGYRMLSRLKKRKVQIYSRNGKDWTPALTGLAEEVQRVKATEAWLDAVLRRSCCSSATANGRRMSIPPSCGTFSG